MSIPYQVTATVTNGEQTEIAALKDGRLLLYHTPMGVGIFLGEATQKRIDQLIFNLNQLRTVLPEDNKPKPKFGQPGFQFEPCPECGSRSLRCGCD